MTTPKYREEGKVLRWIVKSWYFLSVVLIFGIGVFFFDSEEISMAGKIVSAVIAWGGFFLLSRWGTIDKATQEMNEMLANETPEERESRLRYESVRVKYDDMEGLNWIYDNNTTSYNNVNSFHLYIGRRDNGDQWYRLRIQYVAEDWLFIEKYTIKTDTQTYTYTPSGEIKRDNGDGKIWEWCDESISDETLAMIKDIANSQNPKIRFHGSQYVKDQHITFEERQSLISIMGFYDFIKDQK